MVQPHSIAHFSSAYYSSRHQGAWRYDIASRMTPSFPEACPAWWPKPLMSMPKFLLNLMSAFRRIQCVCRCFVRVSNSFDLLWVSGEDTVLIQPSSMNTESPYVEALIPPFNREFTLVCHKTDLVRPNLYFHGANLLAMEDSGLVYHSLEGRWLCWGAKCGVV